MSQVQGRAKERVSQTAARGANVQGALKNH
jgi:hypothetical protein